MDRTVGISTVGVQRTMPAPPELSGWSSDLLDCCDDMNSCCYAFWCWPCFACTTTKRFGERRCLPLLDIFTPAVTAACGLPLCAPPAGLALRVAVRHRYGIKGTLCKDVMASCFCGWCSWCQLAREMKQRAAAAAPPAVFYTASQQGVVHVQPGILTAPYGYGPAPGPPGPAYLTTQAAEPRPPPAPGGGPLSGYSIQSDFL